MITKFTNWRTSSYTNPDGHCVEVAQAADGTIGVRDTKGDPTVILEFTSHAWAHLLKDVKDHVYELAAR